MLFKSTQLRRMTTQSAIHRLGFPLEEYFNMTVKHGMLRGLDNVKPAPTGKAAQRDDAWYFGKHTQRHIPQSSSSGHVPTCAGSDIYTDVAGPFPVPTREGYKYFVLYKCGYTQHQCVYLMKFKDQLLDTWKTYIADMRRFNVHIDPEYIPGSCQHPRELKRKRDSGVVSTPSPELRAGHSRSLHYNGDPQFCISDAEQIYVAGKFAEFNRDHLVGQWTIAPYTHSAHPAEPAIRRIVESALCVLHKSGMPPSNLLYAVLAVVKGANCSYTPVHYCPDHRFKTPQERRYNVAPHISECPAFGSKAIVNIATIDRAKGDFHAWIGFYAGPTHNMKGYRIYRPLTNAYYDRYHVTFDDKVVFGDFMGKQFKDRVQADKLQREYFNSEVDTMLGITPTSNPLLELLAHPANPWQHVPDPTAPRIPPPPPRVQPPSRAVPQPLPVVQRPPPGAEPTVLVEPQAPPPVPVVQSPPPGAEPTALVGPQAPLSPHPQAAAVVEPVAQPSPLAPTNLPVLDPLVADVGPAGTTAPIQAIQRLRQQFRDPATPPPRVLRSHAAAARSAIAGSYLRGVPASVPAFSPAVQPHSPALAEPRSVLPDDLGHVRQALYAAAETTSDLCDEIFGAEDNQTPACSLFSDPEFISDLANCGFDNDEVLMLQLSADASQSATVAYLAASPAMAVPPLEPTPRHDQSRFQLDDATSRKIAATAPPSTQREIDALTGTTQGNLILEAQVDEVLSMLREGRVIARDMRTIKGRLHEMGGKWVVKYKKKLSGLLERVRARWTLRGDRQLPHRDYDPDNVYSPVATKTSHFTIFVLAVQYGLMLFCLDVSKAFMMGPIDKPGIFITIPAGFKHVPGKLPHPDFCPFGEFTTYELLCSLYGLKQAAAVYYATVRALVLAYCFADGSHFTVSPADPCVFNHGNLLSNHYITFSTHIDDKFIACKTTADRDIVTSIFEQAGWKFTIQTMDLVLGVGIKYTIYNPFTKQGGQLELSHSATIADAYKKFSKDIPKECRSPRSMPVSSGTITAIIAQGDSPVAAYSKERHTLFRSVLGTVAHVTNFTHPECAFAVSFASQFLANPSEMHLTMIFGVLLYLYANRDKTIMFHR